jgi:hypothetical protein
MLKNKRLVWIIICSLVVVFVLLSLLFYFKTDAEENSIKIPVYGNIASVGVTGSETVSVPVIEKIEHIKTPKPVKALYMTSWVASTPSLRTRVIDLVKETEANAIMIDIKDETGRVTFVPNNKLLNEIGSPENRIRDLRELIAELHKDNIYVIGRIAVFQDPYLAKVRPQWAVKRASDGGVWKDRKGISWVDAGSKEVWDYIIEIAREVEKVGFDEINFDYVRFPTDGAMSDLAYPVSDFSVKSKPDTLEGFFVYLNKNVGVEVPISADLFGMTTTAQDDMGIGQVFEKALPYFDYVAPMIYPSHYPPGFNGYPDPNAVPYEIIKYVTDSAVTRIKNASSSVDKLRPWLQDFDYPVEYSAEDVRAQKKALYDAGVHSWMMWDPSNKYTREAYD